jgi:hypothetical protein
MKEFESECEYDSDTDGDYDNDNDDDKATTTAAAAIATRRTFDALHRLREAGRVLKVRDHPSGGGHDDVRVAL